MRPERKTQLKRLINEVERHTSSVELGLADGKRQTAKEKTETERKEEGEEESEKRSIMKRNLKKILRRAPRQYKGIAQKIR